ncbi:lactate dehydrogenase [Microbacterium oxydans]|uniref:Ldh family oxidoreductase n=1 Tax=Microbacterium sp. B19(2022) TaxID=2914045 RepID=UPI00143168A5|nr:lactate dehydrogenase [Microbacterium sp. B19(2022)]
MGQVLNGGTYTMDLDAHEMLSDLRAVLRAAAPHSDPTDVELAAFWLIQAELLGLPEFGIRMLARDLERLEGLDSASAPATPSGADDAPIGSVDATGVPGVVALASAVRRAARNVEAHGLAIVGIRGAGALGILGLAARALAARGAVALLAAQSPATVAPWGGQAAAIGTNPLAVGVPRADAPPLVVDYATSTLTLAAVREARGAGVSLPEGSAVDAAGEPTTDPAAAAALLPAGLVGSLTGLVVELLAGVAVGGRVTDPAAPSSRGAVLIAFDPARAGGADIAQGTAALDREWRGAGGHLPARFDALASNPADLPHAIRVSEETASWLRARTSEAPGT